MSGPPPPPGGPLVRLNVGGHRFHTTRTTLTSDPDSMLAAMFGGKHSVLSDEDGFVFIDRNGEHFSHMLDFLRTNGDVHTLPRDGEKRRQLLVEAEFYCIQGLVEALNPSPHRLEAEYSYTYAPTPRGMKEVLDGKMREWEVPVYAVGFEQGVGVMFQKIKRTATTPFPYECYHVEKFAHKSDLAAWLKNNVETGYTKVLLAAVAYVGELVVITAKKIAGSTRVSDLAYKYEQSAQKVDENVRGYTDRGFTLTLAVGHLSGGICMFFEKTEKEAPVP